MSTDVRKHSDANGGTRFGRWLGGGLLLFIFSVPQLAACPDCLGTSRWGTDFGRALKHLFDGQTTMRVERGVNCPTCRDDGKVTIAGKILFKLSRTPIRDRK